MRVLIVKMSSLGDVVHTLPALTDAGKFFPGIEFDWVVEEAFREIPSWHPLVKKVIPMALRRWKRTPLVSWKRGEMHQFLQSLREENYDTIIDAQGLLKSSVITYLAHGLRVGLDRLALREPWARWAYQKTFLVDKNQHAIQRTRHLFSQALNYSLPETIPDYGLENTQFSVDNWHGTDYMVFLHGTTWNTKHWPDEHWITLAKLFVQKGLSVRLFWGNARELERAEKMASYCSNVFVNPKCTLAELAGILQKAKGVVTVDTGIGHLAAALNVPTIGLYGPTDAKKVGVMGAQATVLSSPFECIGCHKDQCRFYPKGKLSALCMEKILPEEVMQKVISYKL